LPGSCGPRCRPEPMPPVVGGSPIGAAAPASVRTRRSTAVAGTIPASSLPRPRWRDATSLRQLPAQSRLAVPTREHQSGGLPIHAAPARSWPTSARPPPTGRLQANPYPTPELLSGGSHLTAPFHIRRSSVGRTWWASSPMTPRCCGWLARC
jgi:hypothetical protein